MYKKILVVVDDRRVTQSAIRQAIELARVHRADILFVYVLPRYVFVTFEMQPAVTLSPEEFQSQAKDHAHKTLAAASAMAEVAGVQSFRVMDSGTDDAHCVCDLAARRHCDLIVVGTEGDNAVMRILSGSIVPGLITAASVPVLICRDRDFSDGSGRRTSVALRARERREERARQRGIEKND